MAPPAGQRQLDGWSCGLFVLMAMKTLTDRGSWDSVVDAKKDNMRALAIQELLTIASAFLVQSLTAEHSYLRYRIWKPAQTVNDVDGDSDVEITDGQYKKREGSEPTKYDTTAGRMMAVGNEEGNRPVPP